MKSEPVVAVIGATGLVGREMLAIIGEREFPYSDLKAFASERSIGEVIEFGDEELTVETLDENSFDGVDIALFAVDGDTASKFVPIAAEAGTICIDNSSFFRMKEGVPLIVPEVNAAAFKKGMRIIANPNCSTAQLVLPLNIINQAAGLKRVVVSTYQSVSGAGKDALDELWSQSLAIFNQTGFEVQQFPHQIAFNCIPQIDVFTEDGYTKEEKKIINESKKILDLPNLRITATTVRVPVFHSHAESVNVETERPLAPTELAKLLEKAPGIELFAAHDEYPMQIGAAGGDTVQVGRIRRDSSVENGLDLWIVSDNLRKGAALNAVQIAEMLLKSA